MRKARDWIRSKVSEDGKHKGELNEVSLLRGTWESYIALQPRREAKLKQTGARFIVSQHNYLRLVRFAWLMTRISWKRVLQASNLVVSVSIQKMFLIYHKCSEWNSPGFPQLRTISIALVCGQARG